ncbi:MAG: M42 family metallopeptidase, partial [Planctomycetes bacterium]|nr:M42 family metallopeptidase [Planctomycetota bacterium]
MPASTLRRPVAGSDGARRCAMRAAWLGAAVLLLAVAATGQVGAADAAPAWHTLPAPVGAEKDLLGLIAWRVGPPAGPPDLTWEQDTLGSLIVRRGPPGTAGPVRLLLALGIDQPCYVVSQIRDDGLLRVRTLARGAGESFHLAREGRPVDVKTRAAGVPGVLLVNNLHLRNARPEVLGEEHMYLDVGADSPGEVAALGIELLDPLVWDETVRLGERFTAGPSAATRAIMGELVDVLVEAALAGSLPEDVAVAFVAQSQVGTGPLGRGGEAV